jgi:hypothetical protein
MEINRNNYQAWFLDFRDNSLDAKQQQGLATFLQNNPDLQDEFLDFKTDSLCIISPDEALVFDTKQKLKKIEIVPVGNIGQDNYEDFIIGHLEHDLDDSQQSEFAIFKAINPAVESEIIFFKHTFLNADVRLSYPAKDQIKKSVSLVPPRQYILAGLSIAALLVLVLMFTNSLVRRSTENSPGIANQEMVSQPIPPQEISEVQRDNLANPDSDKTPDAFAKDMDTRASKPINNPNKSTLKTNTALPSRDNLPPPAPIEARRRLDKKQQFAANAAIGYRTEVTETFQYMLLRDARSVESEPPKGALARIADNIAGKLFGSADDRQQPLLTTLTQNGKQIFMDISQDMPMLSAATQVDTHDNYIAFNENFGIRIRKAPKNAE